MKRSTFAASLVAAAAAPSVVSAAAFSLKVGVGSNDTGSEVWYAQQLGLFAKHGLDVQIEPMQNGASQASAVAGGAVDVGETNVISLANAHERGLPFSFFAPAAIYNPQAVSTMILVPSDSSAKTGKDLEGKTAGVSALHDLTQLVIWTWVKKTGGNPAALQYVEIPAAEASAALERGTIAITTLPEPALGFARQHNRVLVDNLNFIAPRFLLNGWFATTGWLAKNRNAAAAYKAAIVEAGQWANGHHAQSAAIFAQHTKIPRNVIDTMTRATFGDTIVPALLQPLIEDAAAAGWLKPFAAGEIITAV